MHSPHGLHCRTGGYYAGQEYSGYINQRTNFRSWWEISFPPLASQQPAKLYPTEVYAAGADKKEFITSSNFPTDTEKFDKGGE